MTSGAPHLNTPTVPYVPFFDKEFPTKSGRIEFYVERLSRTTRRSCDYKEPIEASPTNPLFKKYPLVFLSTHTRFRTHSQYCNLPWLNGDQQRRAGVPRDQPGRRGSPRDRRRRRGQVFNDRGVMKVTARLTEGDQARRRQLLPGRLGHDQGQALHRGSPEQPDPSDREPGPVVIPNFRSNAAYYDCLVRSPARRR